ncbi:PTS sugar transporter subunit IIA, partial [Mycobacterium tuberculosis]|nr:PTS sugar transporter subunit IIA [Mycobacterium tuberculosis]
LFALLADVAARAYGLDAAAVAAALAARERLGTTGFGGGIAIPHGRIEGLESVRGVMMRLDRPIDFGAVDDSPVDLVFMLLSPVQAGAEHLKALARV